MSRTGTTLEAVKTPGPTPKTMRAGVYREKGIVRVEEVPVPEVGDGEVLINHQSCHVRHLRHRHQEDFSRLCAAAANPWT